MKSFEPKPEIFKRRRVGEPDVATELGVSVPDWADLRHRREMDFMQVRPAEGCTQGKGATLALLGAQEAAGGQGGLRAAMWP